ncbi:MAG: integrase [Candidatus Omnitrophica bacterium]|nr:integrase [Candidatus Omnitrophota bacterium]
MSPGAKMEYLEKIYLRYKKASKKEKTIILNEFCINCNHHRKHAIRLLNNYKRFTKPKPKKRGRPSMYNKDSVIEPLKRIWLAANLPCSKLLKAMLPLWLPHYAQEYSPLSLEATKALFKISPATIDRLLENIKIRYKTRGRATTKPGTLLKQHIPVKTEQWNENKPGFLEADTVAHCGGSLEGMYAYTVDFVDIATGWSEQRAVWGKGERGVLGQIKDVEDSLPFSILGFDSDNGSEFLNWHLFRHFTQRKMPIQFTRSRSYQKQDNCHIEQKNWTHIRQWLGYIRLDNPNVVPLMNDLYTSEWRLYHNFFCPSVKLISKKRIASKTVKRYDKPKTPYRRVLESKHVPASAKRNLKEQMKGLNPFQLRRAMEKKLKKIFSVNRKNALYA